MKVISVKFKENGRSYYFDPCDFEIKEGDYVIVTTARGTECGEVDEMVGAEPFGIAGRQGRKLAADRQPALHLDAVALAVVEPQRLHVRIARQCPGDAGCGVLPAGEQDQGVAVVHGRA